MASKQTLPPEMEQLIVELRPLDRLVRRNHPDRVMNRLLARRRALIRKLTSIDAPTLEASVAKLMLLCARLGEDSESLDLGSRLNLRLACSLLRDMRRLLSM